MNRILSIEERSALIIKTKLIKKLLLIGTGILGSLITILYATSAMYNKFASFTVQVEQKQFTDYGIALCETKDFRSPSPLVTCRANESITNIDGKTLDDKNLGSVDGVQNGTNFICYTFYLKNTGKKVLTYSEKVDIQSTTQGIEKTIRVRIIKKYNDDDKTQTDYAYAKGVDDRGNPIPEEDTTPFYTETVVLLKDVNNFKPGDIMKYTIVIWIEGNDEDTVDSVVGGELKIDMNFSVDGTSVIDDE